ncbi:MAG: hypothetical protein CBD18_08130, partial [Opitutales bacterium TMED158]
MNFVFDCSTVARSARFITPKKIGSAIAKGILSMAFFASAARADISPSTTVDPYVESHLSGVTVKSILTVDDGTIPKTGGGTTRLAGIPDGIGVIDGDDLSPAETGFFYLLVNHELNSNAGVERDHGEMGAFISKWKIDKTTHEVVEGDDLVKTFFQWDEGTDAFVEVVPGVDDLAEFNRFC